MANFLKIPKYSYNSKNPNGPFIYLNLDYVIYVDQEAGEVYTSESKDSKYAISNNLKETWKTLIDYVETHIVGNTI